MNPTHPTPLQWPEVAQRLSRLALPFPQDIIDEVRRRWEEWGQHFIAEIERIADGGEPWDEEADEFDGLFTFATWLVAERRDARAYRPLVRACHCPSDRAEALFGDDVTEALGRMLAAVCDGDLDPLRGLAEDCDAGMWCRVAALHAMLVRVLEGDSKREDVLPWLDAFCTREAARLRQVPLDFSNERDEMLSWAVDFASILGDDALIEKVCTWYAEGLINDDIYGPHHFAKRLGQTLQQRLDEARGDRTNRYIADAAAEMSEWVCFNPNADSVWREPAWLDRALPTLGGTQLHPSEGTYRRDQPKIGRNDPCPCGSGKKYKKCCGQVADAAASDEESGEGGVERCITWLMLHHEDAVRAALQDMVETWAGADGEDEEEALARLDEETWRMIRINLMESLLAGERIDVHGQWISVPELLLGPKGPALTTRERAWIAQLTQRPLRLYTVTQTVPGASLTLCDALDQDAPPVVIEEKTASRAAHVGMMLGARIMTLGHRQVLSGAVYPFANLFVPALLAELREAIEASAEQNVDETVAFTIQSHWLRQYLVPPPTPTLIDKASGQPMLFIRDRYRVRDWPALDRALQSQPDVEGGLDNGWSRLEQGEDGLTRSRLSIERPAEAPDCIDVHYKTRAAAEEGRPWFEALAGDAVEFVERETKDPKVTMMLAGMSDRDDESAAPRPDIPPEAMADIIEKVYRSTYANWADEPIPLLGNRTPREAIRTPAGLERVKGLLRMYEQSEKAAAAREGRRAISYDFLWQQLGLARD